MPSAMRMAEGNPRLEQAVRESRRLLNRRALVAAAAGAIPVPGLDWAVDAVLLTRLIPKINERFGLSPAQLDSLTPHKREQIQKAVGLVGSVLIGKFITRDLVLLAARKIGLRLTVSQATKYVPIAGQAVSAALNYTALRFLVEEHMKDCVQVAREVERLLAPPRDSPRKLPQDPAIDS